LGNLHTYERRSNSFFPDGDRIAPSSKDISQETAFEELRISPHEEIPKGTQRDFL